MLLGKYLAQLDPVSTTLSPSFVSGIAALGAEWTDSASFSKLNRRKQLIIAVLPKWYLLDIIAQSPLETASMAE